MSALFLEMVRTILFLSYSRLRFRFGIISSMVDLAPCGDVAKPLPAARKALAMRKLLGSVAAVVGLQLITSTLGDKHMAIVLPNVMLVRLWHRHVSLFTNSTGVEPLSLLCCVRPNCSKGKNFWSNRQICTSFIFFLKGFTNSRCNFLLVCMLYII